MAWIEYLADGRIYTPCHDRKQRYRVWLRGVIESPNMLRVFPKADKVGWTVSFQLVGDTLRLDNKGGTFYLCTRAAFEEAPEWFRDDVVKAMASPPP